MKKEKYIQRMELVQADYYDELCEEISNKINDLDPLFYVKQINYFCMESESGRCSAFILFNPMEE